VYSFNCRIKVEELLKVKGSSLKSGKIWQTVQDRNIVPIPPTTNNKKASIR